MNWFNQLGEIGLFLYATLKAFLPLPSLEIVLVPMVLLEPDKSLLLAILGGIGTFVGGSIGYGIAYLLDKNFIHRVAKKEDILEGTRLINQYGVIAIFIGGVTPLPDFILAYLAGIAHMNYFLFVFTDGFARFLRSMIVIWGMKQLPFLSDIEQWSTPICLIIMGIFLIKYGLKREI